MSKRFRCHRRTQTPSKHEIKGKTEEQKEYLFKNYSAYSCKDCVTDFPEEFHKCGHKNKEDIKTLNKLSREERKPRGVHMCLARVHERNPKFRCEQCAIRYRTNFNQCGHRTLREGQSELGAFIDGKKTITEPTKIDKEVM